MLKDADKLWRFTRTGLEIDHRRFGIPLPDYVQWIEQQITGWMFTPEAAQLARRLLAASRGGDGGQGTGDRSPGIPMPGNR